MKNVWTILSWITVFSGMAAPAAAAVKRVNNSSPVVIWAFLSFCALIIVNQLIPVISDFIEMKRRTKKEAGELTAVTEESQDSQAGQQCDEQ